jgi:hypothetical protein
MELMKGLITSKDAVITLRMVTKAIGVIMSSIDQIMSARIHAMELSWLKTTLMLDEAWNWDRQIAVKHLPPGVRVAVERECNVWIQGHNPKKPHLHALNGKYHYNEPPLVTVYTDACEWQKGTWVPPDEERGHPEIDSARPFTGAEIYAHITLQETIAAAEGIMHCVEERNYTDGVVASKVDATAAVKYIKCLGGRKRKFTAQVVELQQVLKRRRLP